MKYVIIRDDDTNAFTPIEYLEKLYRPFLQKGLPINLAVIPNVKTQVFLPNNELEYFLPRNVPVTSDRLSIGTNQALVRYLLENKGYCIAQHGYDHKRDEFECHDSQEIIFRITEGKRHLAEAGFPDSNAFVAPYDKISRASYKELAKYFPIISTNFFEKARLPFSWWPNYFIAKALHKPHWKNRQTLLLSHPSAYLSSFRPYHTIWDEMIKTVENSTLTVLLTHWWEYFKDGDDGQRLINLLHRAADYFAASSHIKVISFDDLLDKRVAREIFK